MNIDGWNGIISVSNMRRRISIWELAFGVKEPGNSKNLEMKKNIQKYLTGMMLLERYKWESVEKELSRKLDTTW